MEKDRLAEELAKQDWADIHARLVEFSRKRGATGALAEDLAQNAIERVFAFDSEWDPSRYPVLVSYLMGVVKMLLFKERRAAKRTTSYDHHAEDDGADDFADPRAFGPERVEEADLRSRGVALLRARLAKRGREEALKVLELSLDGIETPADIAEATGWSPSDVIKFRLQMHRAALEVAEDLAGREDEEDEV